MECTIASLPSLTFQYMSDTATVELSRDCGSEGTRRVQCHGEIGEARDRIYSQLRCADETFEDPPTTAAIGSSPTTDDVELSTDIPVSVSTSSASSSPSSTTTESSHMRTEVLTFVHSDNNEEDNSIAVDVTSLQRIHELLMQSDGPERDDEKPKSSAPKKVLAKDRMDKKAYNAKAKVVMSATAMATTTPATTMAPTTETSISTTFTTDAATTNIDDLMLGDQPASSDEAAAHPDDGQPPAIAHARKIPPTEISAEQVVIVADAEPQASLPHVKKIFKSDLHSPSSTTISTPTEYDAVTEISVSAAAINTEASSVSTTAEPSRLRRETPDTSTAIGTTATMTPPPSLSTVASVGVVHPMQPVRAHNASLNVNEAIDHFIPPLLMVRTTMTTPAAVSTSSSSPTSTQTSTDSPVVTQKIADETTDIPVVATSPAPTQQVSQKPINTPTASPIPANVTQTNIGSHLPHASQHQHVAAVHPATSTAATVDGDQQHTTVQPAIQQQQPKPAAVAGVADDSAQHTAHKPPMMTAILGDNHETHNPNPVAPPQATSNDDAAAIIASDEEADANSAAVDADNNNAADTDRVHLPDAAAAPKPHGDLTNAENFQPYRPNRRRALTKPEKPTYMKKLFG